MRPKTGSTTSDELIYLYNASAVAATGYLTLPVSSLMELQASIALPMGGGYGRVRVENFTHHGIFTFRSAESEVGGRSSVKKNSRNTLAQSVIEGFNVHNMVTCDRIVSRIAVHQPMDGSPASIVPFGSTFENLRIGGYLIEPDLATDWFTEYDTFDKFAAYYPTIKDQFNKMSMIPSKDGELPQAKGIVGCTLVRGYKLPLPGGITQVGLGLQVPEFGMVYLAEFFMEQNKRQLRMIRTELGCGSEGCYGGGSTSGNGVGWP